MLGVWINLNQPSLLKLSNFQNRWIISLQKKSLKQSTFSNWTENEAVNDFFRPHSDKKTFTSETLFLFSQHFFTFNGKPVFSLSLIGAATSDRADNCLEPFSARLRLLWINRTSNNCSWWFLVGNTRYRLQINFESKTAVKLWSMKSSYLWLLKSILIARRLNSSSKKLFLTSDSFLGILKNLSTLLYSDDLLWCRPYL